MSDHLPVDGKVVARFATTPEEFVEAVKVLSSVLYGFGGVSRAQDVWQRARLFLMIAVLTFAVLTLGNFVALQPGGFTTRDFMIAVIVAIVTAFGVLIGLTQFQMRRMRKALSLQPAKENVEVVAGDLGIWWNTETQKHFWLYSSFNKVVAFKGGYYLVTGLSGGFIPGRGFADDAEKLAFETLFNEKLPTVATAQFFAAKAK